MRRITTIALALLSGTTTLAAQGHDQDPDKAVAGGGTLPAGWEVRTDHGRGENDIRFTATAEGYHLVLGPRVILYHPADTRSGDYRVSATFAEEPGSGHAEAFGLFIGGHDLQADDQGYTYFLIRGDGKFLVKKRHGSKTSAVTDGWTAHEAIAKLKRGGGRTTNRMAVEVSGGELRMMVNGQTIYTAPAGGLDPDGIVGIRANHNIDMLIDDYNITGG